MSALFSNITLPEANMWNSCEIVCEKQVYFTQFSYDFHNFSHMFHIFFHMHVKLYSVKGMWKIDEKV